MIRAIIFIFTVLGTVCCLGTQRNVPGDFSTLQAAIDGSTTGDVIVLAPGTYTGEGNRDLNFKGKAITLQSSNPTNSGVTATTILDCQGSEASPHRAFIFSNRETANSIIDGITVTNGWMQTGGAIYCDNASPTIRNCVFRQNTANYYAGGIYCTNSSAPALTQCTFIQNNTVQVGGLGGLDGGAVYCNTSSNAKITSCTFTNNSGKAGGGIYCNASNPVISLCTFTGNTAGSFGGAVACWASAPVITNCLMANNIAQYAGGGVSCQSTSVPSLVNCTLSRNTGVDFSGGGVYCNSSSPSLKNMILWDNNPTEIKVVSGTPAVTYSNIEGGWSGTGNLNADPLFANPAQGDFHLKSVAGRLDPQTGTWVTDTETSLCVDGGDPAGDPSNEPAGTGQIVDLGFYGNTAEASRTPDKVDLTITVVEGQGTVSPTSKKCNQGILLPLTAVPAAGYRVKAWTGTNDNSSIATTNTVTMDTHRTVTVAFEALPCTLTLSVIGDPPHGTVTSDPAGPALQYGDQVTFTAVPETGYRVKAWTGTDRAPMAGSYTNSLKMIANATVKVEFEAKPTDGVTLSAGVQEGQGQIFPTSGSYNINAVVGLIATPATGWRVKGWVGTAYDLSTGTINTVTMTNDKTVGVKFEKVYTLLASVSGGHGSLSPGNGVYLEGTVVTLTATPTAGYRTKWTGTNNDDSSADTNTVTMNADKTVSVVFEKVYQLTATVLGGTGTINPAQGTYPEGADVTLTATPAAGYRVKSWSGTILDTSTAATNTAKMDADKTVGVTFEGIAHPLTITQTEHGTVTANPAGAMIPYDTVVNFTAAPETGYRVAAWNGTDYDPAAGSNNNLLKMNGERSVSATFELLPENNVTLSAEVKEGEGQICPKSGNYNPNAVVTLIATAATGWRVKSWEGTANDLSTEAINTVTMTGPKTVGVRFEKTVRLTASVVGGHGTISPAEGVYPAGALVSLIAAPDEGYRVKSWTGTNDDASTSTNNAVTFADANKTVTVTFEPIPYTLTLLVPAGHGTVSASPAGPTIPYDTLVTLTAVPDENYRVKTWYGTDHDDSLAGTNTNILRIKGDRTVTVEFEALPAVTYTLAASIVEGQGQVTPTSGIYDANSVVTLTAAPDAGWQMKGWEGGTENDQATSQTNTVNMTANKTIKVRFAPIPSVTHTLTVSIDAGLGAVSPAAGTFNEGEIVHLTATAQTGYQVDTWTGTDQDPNLGNIYADVSMTADKHVRVRFVPLPTVTSYTLTASVLEGNGTVSPANALYTEGSTVTLTATPDTGWRVKAWSGTDNDSSTANTNSVVMTAIKDIKVSFELIPYTLTLSPATHGTITSDPVGPTFTYNTQVTLTAAPELGYKVKWQGTDNDQSAENINKVTMTADKTVTATFELIPYTLTLSPATHGTVTGDPAGPTILYGTQVTLTAKPDTGYQMDKWQGTDNDTSIADTNSVTMTDNKTVLVTFKPSPYTLTLNPGTHGTVTSDPAGPTIPYDTQVTLTADPETGFRVKAWTGTDHDDLPPGTLTNTLLMKGDQTVTVEFEPLPPVTYTLAASVVEGQGDVTPTSGTYNANTAVPLTATPDEGWRVKGWNGTDNDQSTANINSVTMTANKEVKVSFEPITYTLQYSQTVEHGTLSVNPDQTVYNHGTVVTLTAAPDPGYQVKSWAGTDNDTVKTDNNAVTMIGNKEITVTFELIPPITYSLTAGVNGQHGTVSPTEGTYNAGIQVTLTATPENGYRVAAWSGTDNDTVKDNTNTVTMTANKEVKVTFELIPPITYSLTAGVNGQHGTVSPTDGTYIAGTQVTLTATPENGYRVAAWSGTDNDTVKDNTNTVTITANKDVKVTFELIPSVTYSLTASVVGGHGTVSPTGETYNAGTQVTLTATPENGYRVAAWSGTDNDTVKTDTNTVTMTTDKTVTVTFEAIPANPTFTLTASVAGGHGTVSPTEGTYDAGTQVPLTATPENGYQTREWTGTDDDTTSANANTVTLNSNKTVTVAFEPISLEKQYSLTVSVLGGHGSVRPAAGRYAEGMRIYITATPDPGYRVKAWTNTDFAPLPGTDENSVTMTQDKEVTVTFEAIPADVYYNLHVVVLGGSGTVSPAEGKFLSSSVIDLTASPAAGWRVKSWIGTDNDQSIENTNSVTMSYDRTVMVELEALPSQPDPTDPNQPLLPETPTPTPTSTETPQELSPLLEEAAPQGLCGFAAPLLISLLFAFGYLTKE